MTPEEESERIRALLREVHRHDEQCTPFERLLQRTGSSPRARRSPWAFRATVLVAIAVAGAMLIVLPTRRERPAPRAPPSDAVAWSSSNWEGPLDFLLKLPGPPVADSLPSPSRSR
jgi:hypothetical protein